ncbi:MAG: YncE family protein [Terriglobia bacterium]
MRYRNYATGLAIAFRRMALLTPALALTASYCCSKPPAKPRQAWSITTKYSYGPILEDVSRRDILLLNQIGSSGTGPQSWNVPDPKLLLRTPSGIEPLVVIPLPEWPKYQYELPEGVAELLPGPLEFVGDGGDIVGVQGPWLVLISVSSRKEIRRVLALKDLRDFEQPKVPIPVLKSPAPGKLIDTGKTEMVAQAPLPPLLAVSPVGDRLAVAYNGPAKHWIFVYTSDLTRRLASWQVSKRVEDLCWSRDGKLFGVLYPNSYTRDNPNRKFAGRHSHIALAGAQNISIFDAISWKERLAFATGGYDAKAVFSPDGKLVYVIRGWRDRTGKEDIRAFSTATGKLERTIKVKAKGVRHNFAVSPDGRLIAVESYSGLGFPFIFDQPEEYLDVNAGFVILDAATGRLLFRAKRRTSSAGSGSLPIFFTADGQMLIVNFAGSNEGDAEGRILGYSLPGPHR